MKTRLKADDRVIETGQSCMYGAIGIVFKSENKYPAYGSLCVKWYLDEGEMSTAVTHGTRRVVDVLKDLKRHSGC